MQIGSTVLASSDFHDIQGVIVGGFADGQMTTAEGVEIDLDDVVSVKSDDDGKVCRLHGWLWSFEPA